MIYDGWAKALDKNIQTFLLLIHWFHTKGMNPQVNKSIKQEKVARILLYEF
mgnify:CR=1 FL=1